MILDADQGILIRLWVAAPLLYIGLMMALEPADFIRSFENLGRGLRTFIHQEYPGNEPSAANTGPGLQVIVQAGGILMALFSVLLVVA